MGAALSLPFDGIVPSAGLEVGGSDEHRALFAECRDCEAIECFPSSVGLPAGWLEVQDDRAANGQAVLCPDCRGNAAANDDGPLTPPRLVHCGYRLTHVAHLAAGFATLRLHAGANPRPGGPDFPATFLADREGIRQLIRDLEAIDVSLTQGEK